ncbi:PAS domain S-box protein [Neobacillus sp. MM2021_6]|uniref:PAS domain-containing sensor histidine kinase n=1 Tax=Bacillaceae TaxID=186817 RepID=UPI00140A3C78|nr:MULTISPECIES: PAS domain S-box protein [Bacillaceae]MBO0959368.1 PAS domain S-box protein [Neobacillus sp. MM2021_6]NHC19683.1 PAS domain S-box protein [Bacillus sp. MM2020_4]
MVKCFPIFGEEKESVVYNPDELMDLFLNSTADGICIVDMENRFIRINPMYTKIFGYIEEDVLGRTFEEFPNPDTVKEIMAAVKRGEAFHNMNAQRKHKDGTILDVAVSYSPFRNLKGEIIAIIAVYRDITERLNMERELKRTRELYRLITENTADMIKLYSKDKKIVYASPSHEKGIGYTPEQLIGRKAYDLILPEEIEYFDTICKEISETGEPRLFQIKIKTGTNDIIDSETTISPIHNDQGEIESFVTVGRNITDRIKNDDALRNLDRLSITGQLAAGVAHEIRNPLTSLKGFSKLLKGTTNKEKQEDYLSIIMNELDRIDMIVNEFMSLAKPQAIQFERESLHTILESTVKILHPQALLHNVQIINRYHTNEIDLLCIPHQLKQVFVNFLKNAIESMQFGGTVHIDVQKVGEKRVQIGFTDEGIGIDTEVMGYLGTPFYTTKDKGIGLGLTVSNKIIQEHNGTMKIESQLGKGTTVKVELNYI